MIKKYFFILVLVVFVSSMTFATIATDPVQIGASARLLALGKSFVSVADDSSAIFVNPAGLSQLNTWSANSMLGKHLNEYNQIVMGYEYPTSLGTFGLGYTSYSISVSVPTVYQQLPIPILSGEANYRYGNYVYLISYSRKLDSLYPNLYGGATLKLFQGELAGTGINTLTGNGMDIDLGLLYKLNTAWQLGLALQSILPASMGGKIHWSDNTEASYPATVKAGASYKARKNLTISLDSDFFPTQSSQPILLHLGAEWLTTPLVTLRGGIDQGTQGNSTTNNLTLGVGLNFAEFSFDYAYHTYFNESSFSSHYISLSYNPLKKAEERPKEYFNLNITSSREIVYQESIELLGVKLDGEVAKITMNGEALEVNNNIFRVTSTLKFGSNLFDFIAYDKNKKALKAIKLNVVRLKAFKDVAADYWAKESVEYLATIGIISGFPDNTFKPEKAVNRAEMCALLVKSSKVDVQNKLTSPEAQKFTDVSNKHWAAGFIKTAAQLKLVTGYPDKSFKPGKDINRAEGVSIIARFDNLLPARVIEAPFSDLPGRHWAAESVTAAKEGGLLDYLKDKPFEPNKPLSRGETAYILSRTKFAKDKISEMLK